MECLLWHKQPPRSQKFGFERFDKYDVLLNVYPNGSTSNLSFRFLRGNGSNATSEGLTRFPLPAATSTSNTFGNGSVYFPNYAGATNKSFSVDAVTENNSTEAFQAIKAGLWSDTTAISSLTFTVASGDLVIGTTISLYKITKGSDGIVTTS